jgi:hypothetical protein
MRAPRVIGCPHPVCACAVAALAGGVDLGELLAPSDDLPAPKESAPSPLSRFEHATFDEVERMAAADAYLDSAAQSGYAMHVPKHTEGIDLRV